MSKEAAARAMREARYAQRTARAGSTAARRRPPVAPATVADAAPVDAAPVAAGDGRCGHRSMNGRSCTREQGHAAKSHRYS